MAGPGDQGTRGREVPLPARTHRTDAPSFPSLPFPSAPPRQDLIRGTRAQGVRKSVISRGTVRLGGPSGGIRTQRSSGSRVQMGSNAGAQVSQAALSAITGMSMMGMILPVVEDVEEEDSDEEYEYVTDSSDEEGDGGAAGVE